MKKKKVMKDKLKKILKKIGCILGIYVFLITIFTGIMTWSYSLDNSSIIKNVSESAQTIEKEGVYPRVIINNEKAQLDNFTDSWMLTIAMGREEKSPIDQAMSCYYRISKNAKEKADNLIRIVNGEETELRGYMRYWHGYQSILRPLLKVFKYEEIRYINMFCMIGLFIISSYLIKEKIGTGCAIAFVVSMLMSMIIIVPMSLQFSSIYYITLISIVILTLFSERIMKKDLMYIYFFFIGSITSFFDLLTAPIMTLGFSLIVYIYLELNNKSIKKNLIEVISKSFDWSIGYVMTWSGKLILAEIITKKSVVNDALNQVLSRVSNKANEVDITKLTVIMKNINEYIEGINIKLIFIIMIVLFIAFMLMKNKNYINMIPTLFIALYPIICYILLTNHSFIHFWFTYRNLAVSCFAILSFAFYAMDPNKFINRIN